jgi:tetratricopeptide (TPR) repeat protein
MTTKSANLLDAIKVPRTPFPGLRPFEFDESHLFYGRDGQVERLIAKLTGTRFLAVVGSSGSGKSSLVRAGLLPALLGGMMASAGSKWHLAVMRPGNDPIGSLATALNQPESFGSDEPENAAVQKIIAEATLRRGSLGLVETVRQNAMPANENLLVVVDQFEELFRFAREASRKTREESDRYRNDAAGFVKLLLEAHTQREANIYVVLTMRSDFLGDCAQFWDLPEAINESQYLIPRLTRDQLREVITGPVALGGGEITPRLVTQLLNDIGENQDELPVLQHLLMRVWDEWKQKRLDLAVEVGNEINRKPHAEIHDGDAIDLCCYEAVGGMANALSQHADEAYSELPDDHHREVAEKLFKALTEKGPDNREIRRPITLAEICAVTDSSQAEVITVIETFRHSGRSFLMPPADVALKPESLVDISHESLIRGWARLKEWVDEEARSSRIYRRVAETAVLHKEGGAGLWRDPDLQIALTWRDTGKPNQVWARRYHPEFALAQQFLEDSVKARDAQTVADEKRRKREIQRTRLTALIFGVAFLFSLGMGVYAYGAKNKADLAKDEAVAQKKEADAAKDNAFAQKNAADIATAEALAQKKQADIAKNEALAQKKAADIATAEAVAQKKEADVAKNEALAQKKAADIAKNDALAQKKRALEQSELAKAEALKGRALGALKDNEPGEALTHFTELGETYDAMKDSSGKSYALQNIAEIYRDRVPFSVIGQELGFGAEDLEDAEEGDARAYAEVIKQYSQMMTISMAMEVEGKDEKTFMAELSKDGNRAVAYYNQALAANKLNPNPDQSFREAGVLKNLGDLEIGMVPLRLSAAETDTQGPDKEAAKKEQDKAIERAIQYYLEASAAYGKAKKPLEEAGVITRIADLVGKDLKKPAATPNADEQTQPAVMQAKDISADAAKLESTVGFYEEAADAFRRARKPLKQASVLIRIGDLYKGLPKEYSEKDSRAILYYERALKIYRTEKNFKKEADISEKLAQMHENLSERKEAIAAYKAAFRAYRQVAATGRKQTNEPFSKAAEMLQNVADKSGGGEAANDFFEEAINSTGDDSVSKARTLAAIASYYKEKDDVVQALKYYSRKQETWRQSGNLLEEGNTLVEIGLLHNESQNVAAAIATFDEARKVYSQIDPQAKDASGARIRTQLLGNLIRIADIYALQDKQKAIAAYEEALQIEMLAPYAYSMPQILQAEGRILLELKTPEGKAKAEQLFQRVLEFNRSRKFTDGEASTLANIGDLYKTAGDKVEARAYYERARIAYARNKNAYNYGLTDAIKKIGELEAEANPGKTAVDYYLSLAESAGQAHDSLTQGAAFEMYAGSFRGPTPNNQKAIDYFERARLAYQAGGLKAQEVNTIRSLASIYLSMGNKQKSQELIKQADDLARNPR